MAALEFQSGFRNNTIVILDGLKQSDMQTAARLHEELTDMGLAGNAPACTFYKIASYADLIAALNETIERCKHGLLPILHFEAHGEKDSGLELGDSGEVGRWAELHDYFQRITEAANEAISLGQSPDYPALRAQFKASVRISRERFSRIASTFMHGRYSVTYEQFMKFVRQ